MNHINAWTILKFLARWAGRLIWYALVVAGYAAILLLDLLGALLGGVTYMSIQADRATRALHHRNSFNRARAR